MGRLPKLLITIACCIPSFGTAEDNLLNDLISDLETDASSIVSLNETIETASPEELQVLFRRISEVSNDRPDLADIAIQQGLTSDDDVLRHQALWLVLSRADTLGCRIDFEKYSGNENNLRGRVGGVIQINLFETNESRRSIWMIADPDGETDNRIMSIVGDNVFFRNGAEDWALQGSFSLSADGTALAGPIDYNYVAFNDWRTDAMYCEIPLR